MEAVLGSGASAEVYRVRHAQLQSVHALKVLAEVDASRRQRLMEEGRVQASLRHPNLVGVTDVLQHEGRPALVMEYVNGPTLRDWLDQGGIPPARQAVELATGIARGMRYAHERGLVHRDLKPANVLLEVSPAGIVPRVLDFGLVRQTWSGPEELTEHGAAIGTPAYMSPEQIRDPTAVDERSDLFSLGCILYEMLHGVPPFPGVDPVEVVQSIQSDRRRPISEDLPPVLQRLLDRLLQHDPDARVSTAAQLLVELQDPELLRNQQLQAHPAMAMSSLEGQLARPRAPVFWAPLVVPAIGLMLGVVVVLTGRPAPVEAAPAPAPAGTLSVEQGTPAPLPAPVAPVDPAADPAPVAPRPVPAVAPVPAVPVPVAALPEPEPAADPEPARPRRGVVEVVGDAEDVVLVRGSARITRLSSVPPGTWRIRATFDGEVVDAGEVEVHAGQTATIRCVAFALRCRAE